MTPYFAIVLSFQLLFQSVEGHSVIKLTVDSFDKFLEDNPLTLVKFYAPWCGHCKSLEPHYEEASDNVPEGIKLAEVDVTVEELLGTRYEIKGFPTMKFFRGGAPQEFTGGRTSEDIIQWVHSMIADPVISINTFEEASEKYSSETMVIAYLSEDSPDRAKFESVAVEFRDSGAMVGKFIVLKPTEDDHNVVDVIRSGATKEDAERSDNFDTLSKFVIKARLPVFGPIDGENFGIYLETGIDFVWFAGSSEDVAKVSKAMVECGRELRGEFHFVWLNTETFSRQAEDMLGVTEFPAVVRTVNGPGRYIFNGDIAAESLMSWITDMKSGTIVPILKSEAIPETNSEPVKVVVGAHFDDVVNDDVDVLLAIHAPWCGHCKSLLPTYEKLAEELTNIGSDVVIAKLDGTANEIADDAYSFQGFPTIYWKKAGSFPVMYEGNREFEDFMTFIENNSTKKFEWTRTNINDHKTEEL